MNKIAVIGCGGAGKTSLSIALGEKLSLPLYHLDKLYWQSNWKPSNRENFREFQERVFANDRWIMDGNYGGTMEARLKEADTIIFLDLPTATCLWGVIKRYIKYRNSSRPDMTEGNNERLTFEFLKYVLFYRRRNRPVILKMIETLSEKEIVVLTSREEVNYFVNEIQ